MRHLHRTMAGVEADMSGLRFNTVIAKLIEFNNALTQHTTATGTSPRSLVEPLVQMLSPLCPHLAEELWHRLGHSTTVTYVPFPVADPALLVEDAIEVPVQVNGKVRGRISIAPDADDDAHIAAAMALENVVAALDGKTPLKTIVVRGRTVNIVVK
jgi:leucyl-tRNA synthetase